MEKLELFMRPLDWSDLYRKLFVVTIPITGPIWLLCMIIIISLLCISIPFLYGVLVISSVWEGKDLTS